MREGKTWSGGVGGGGGGGGDGGRGWLINRIMKTKRLMKNNFYIIL